MHPQTYHIARQISFPCRRYVAAGNGIKTTLLLLLINFAFSHAYGQKTVDYSIHANIIYHFTKYINWPEHKKTNDFIVGVMGESQIYSALENSLANKKVGGQKIVVRLFDNVSSITACHIIFLGDEESYLISKIAAKTVTTNTLLVTESGGSARKGSCINFVIIADRLKLEINKQNIEKRGLDIASELLQLGKLVE